MTSISNEKSDIDRSQVDYDALVLAGGQGNRLGGHDKAGLILGGHRLLDIVLAAVAGARSTVVVGQVDVPHGVLRTVEHPPGGGPVAGIAAGVATLSARGLQPWTLVIAVDQPGAEQVIPLLLERVGAVADDVDAVAAHSEVGPTWLLAAYRSTALSAAVHEVGDPTGQSVRRLVSRVRFDTIEVPNDQVRDIDTWDDHRHWQARWGASPSDR